MKLATQLSLLLVGALLAAILAMGAFFAFNLERGFVAYINAQQLRQLDVLAAAATRFAERQGNLDPLLRDRRLWGRLVRGSEEGTPPRDLDLPPRSPMEERRPPDRLGPPFGGEDRRPPPFGDDRRPPPFGDDRRPPPFGDDRRPPMGDDRKGPPGENMGLVRRFFLLGPERRMPEGEPLPRAGSKAPVEREIKVDGKVMGYVLHYPYEHVSRAEDTAFLRSQFLGVALVALVLLLVGMFVAPLAARRWTAPLREIGRATGRVARGEPGVRVAAGGASEIEALATDVNAMAASLERLDESRKRWIAQSAHELRTPLMVLRGEIEALQDGVRPTDAKALASLSEEVRHLAKLVEDLHLVAVADMGELPCRKEPVELGAVAERAVERFRERAKARGLEIGLAARELSVVEADETRLNQLLDNLLENSLRYTDAPGRVEVSVASEGPLVRLAVEDSPPAVPREASARIFEPLHKVDPARSRKEGGSGLGLSVCRAIAQAHGASIAARPSRLGGLAVEVRFPRHR